VAGEVRILAQRSAFAAKEIKELISDSVGKTTEGTQQVENAGNTMQEIVLSVKRVSDIISEIAAASQEQSIGIEQVNDAIMKMDDVTQQNTALVEEAAAAAESMMEQADELLNAVSVFILDDSIGHNNSDISNKITPKPRISAPNEVKSFSFEDAENAHVKWKMRLVQYISGKSHEDFDVATVSCDDKCDLGKWIYGPATPHSALPEYKNLRSAHADFHMSVGSIIKCVHDHKVDEAKSLLGGEFAITSKRTISAIVAMRDKTKLATYPALVRSV